ncbi:unnamed protein product [Brassicogethes aeneus]|uniref:DUF4806 domain-containing protein n=1 Tax=Brassicogethes aeneus TaxID=1431903 RepID=A0A9P0BD96_BRAAE|nr:unnamed protein product [Brassicogethes aeneus]
MNSSNISRNKQSWVGSDSDDLEIILPATPSLNKLKSSAIGPVTTNKNSRSKQSYHHSDDLISIMQSTPSINKLKSSDVPVTTNKNCQCSKELPKVLGLLQKLSLNQDKILREITVINSNIAILNPTEAVIDIETKISTSKEELEHFNTKLADEEYFAQNVRKFKLIGGKDVHDSTRRFLSKILTNSLAMRYNWRGRHDKFSFEELKQIILLIVASLRQNSLTNDVTIVQVENSIKNWLRLAGDRDGGRSQRKKSK